uniref:Uncharacterized protein n=1 Tax=Ditylenchus dipsaci TaxID=166011 RepID=A0A915ENB0_9BILA
MPIFESYSRKTEKKGKHEQRREASANAAGGGGSEYRQYSSRSTSVPGQPYVTSAASSVRNGYSQHNGGSGLYRAGQTVAPMDQRYYDTAWSTQDTQGRQRQGFSKSSSYEMKEHYERKSRKKGAGAKAVQEKALNEDANKLTSEIDPNDPMAHRLKDELRATNEHFYDLLNRAQKGPEPDYSNQFDEKMAELLKNWKKLGKS